MKQSAIWSLVISGPRSHFVCICSHSRCRRAQGCRIDIFQDIFELGGMVARSVALSSISTSVSFDEELVQLTVQLSSAPALLLLESSGLMDEEDGISI